VLAKISLQTTKSCSLHHSWTLDGSKQRSGRYGSGRVHIFASLVNRLGSNYAGLCGSPWMIIVLHYL